MQETGEHIQAITA